MTVLIHQRYVALIETLLSDVSTAGQASEANHSSSLAEKFSSIKIVSMNVGSLAIFTEVPNPKTIDLVLSFPTKYFFFTVVVILGKGYGGSVG